MVKGCCEILKLNHLDILSYDSPLLDQRPYVIGNVLESDYGGIHSIKEIIFNVNCEEYLVEDAEITLVNETKYSILHLCLHIEVLVLS